MNTVIAWIKKIRLKQILTVFVAGILLFFTQACNRPTVAGQPPQPSTRPNAEVYVPKGENATNRYEGGMNNFSDVDPRSKDAKARAEFLKENAAQNQAERATNNPAEAFRRVTSERDDLGRNVQQKAEDLENKAENTAEDFAKGTKRGFENIQDNTQDTVRNIT
ncbi:MAG: hypothetical protein N2235_18215, partial [Fischerella sp.]|nr:hypothetical protein [Fischerella sp.]